MSHVDANGLLYRGKTVKKTKKKSKKKKKKSKAKKNNLQAVDDLTEESQDELLIESERFNNNAESKIVADSVSGADSSTTQYGNESDVGDRRHGDEPEVADQYRNESGQRKSEPEVNEQSDQHKNESEQHKNETDTQTAAILSDVNGTETLECSSVYLNVHQYAGQPLSLTKLLPPSVEPASNKMAKYWSQRYRLFSRYDQGVCMDNGEFSSNSSSSSRCNVYLMRICVYFVYFHRGLV